MNASQPFPRFDEHFPDLNEFVLSLVQDYESGKLNSWDDLETKVQAHFTPDTMAQMESRVAGWQKMASYSGGITLVHVMCVFLGLFMLPEFQSLADEQQQLAKWVILFHDVDKFHIRGKKDTMHAFRSAALAARMLPRFGFPTTSHYQEVIAPWSEYIAQAFTQAEGASAPTPDNRKLPNILAGIDRMFGAHTPAALIVRTILFHLSFHENDEYPTPAPLSDEEIKRYISRDLIPFSRVMMLADNEGWTLFEPERESFRQAALAFFARVEALRAEDDGETSAAAPVEGAVDKKFWLSLAGNDYRVPEGRNVEALTRVLFGYLASTDSELRDDIAYIVYANWLKRQMYTPEELGKHIETLLANLETGIGESGTDSVFLRAFSVLFLAEIVHNDNKKPCLGRDQIERILRRGLWYLEAEQDARAYIPIKGWAHALAHTADLMLVLGRNQNLDKEELQRILEAIASKMVRATSHLYIHGEDERLANAVVQILRRGVLSRQEAEDWANGFLAPEGSDWKGAYTDEQRNCAFQNTRNLLRSIHLELIACADEIPGHEALKEIFLNLLKDFRPY